MRYAQWQDTLQSKEDPERFSGPPGYRKPDGSPGLAGIHVVKYYVNDMQNSSFLSPKVAKFTHQNRTDLWIPRTCLKLTAFETIYSVHAPIIS